MSIPLHHVCKEQRSYPGHSRLLLSECWDPFPELQTEMIKLTLTAAFFSLKYVSSLFNSSSTADWLLLGLRGIGWSRNLWDTDNKQKKKDGTSVFSLWEIKLRLIKASRSSRIVFLKFQFSFHIIPTLCYLVSDH